MGPSLRPRSSSAATTSWTARTWTRPSRPASSVRGCTSERWRSAPSWTSAGRASRRSRRRRARRRPPVPGGAGAGGCDPDPGPRRLRPGRGCRPGGVHPGPADMARARRAEEPRRLDHDDGPQPGDRSVAPRAHPAREDRGDRPALGARGTRRRRDRRERDPRRPAAADLHLLPPGPAARRARRPHAENARGSVDGRDRARLPRFRTRDGPTHRPRQAEDPRRGHPLPRPAPPAPARAHPRRAGHAVPSVQRGGRLRPAAPPSRVPPPELLPERLPGVLATLYLVFNEGYGSTSGPLVRVELCEEAIRLARVLVELMPNETENAGLLALMLLQHSRREARTTPEGELVLLEDQDRARWDHDAIDEGLATLDAAIAERRPGPYQLQAAIAALHARAPRPEDTDWPQIAALYGRLAEASPSPIIELNRAVAIAMADGPARALPLVDALAGDLDGYHLFHSTRADLLRRLDRRDESARAYGKALELATNPSERAFLEPK